MKQFNELISVAEKLLGPNGCPWDLKQTFTTLQPYLLEEVHEVIEAVDLNDDAKILEELGDLLYILIFYGKLGEKQGRFSLGDIIDTIKEKLIRRHPHVFGDVKADTVEEIKENWEKIKAQEKGKSTYESVLDGIPPTLPSVVRAQKIIERMDRATPFSHPDGNIELSEEEIGSGLLSLIVLAHRSGINAEMALRRALSEEENQFRQKEKKS